MSENADIDRGVQAKDLLDNPLLAEALSEAKRQIVEMWENTPSRDSDGREWLWLLHQSALRFEGVLKGYIDTGKIAKANLPKTKSLKQRMKSVI